MVEAYLKRLKVQNFKSFSDIDIELKKFNVIIGTNASGKSNFVQIFNFLKDIREHGFYSAISLQGGIEYIRNFNEKSDRNLLIELEMVFPEPPEVRIPFHDERFHNHRVFYSRAKWRFELSMGKISDYKILQDDWDIDILAYHREKNKQRNSPSFSAIGKLSRNKEKVTFDMIFSEDGTTSKPFKIFPELGTVPNKELLLESYLFIYYYFPDIVEFFDHMSVYDFDPKLAKNGVSLRGMDELEIDGANLAIVLRSVISDSESKRKFTNLITDLLPFINSVDTEELANKSVVFTLTENYFKNRSLPSLFISDGTANITALIVALYFQHNSLTIFEEPERNMHPSLISKVISMMNEASVKRQILITTHNPEIVRHARLENLLAVRRNDAGFSEIIRPVNQEEIRMFLANDMEIGELYIQNILGG